MDRREAMEIVIGGVLNYNTKGKGIDPSLVNMQSMASPYLDILQDFIKGDDVTKLMDKHSFNAVSGALEAWKVIEETDATKTAIHWTKMLDDAASKDEVGFQLDIAARKLKKGEDIDVGKVLNVLGRLGQKVLDFVGMDEVKPEKNVWKPTWYEPLDLHVGGIPKHGLTIVGGASGIGKTTFVLNLLTSMARQGKRVGFLSFEMTLGQIAMRLLQMEKLTKEEQGRILASEEICGPHEVYAKVSRLAATYKDLHCVAIDFADMMVEEEQSEAVMGEIYRIMATMSKRIKIPIILICQLNRAYVGGLPRVTNLRYSGMAEHMASLILLLYNPDSVWIDQGSKKDTNPLPYVADSAYVIVGKSRYGFKQGGVGAFLVDWSGGLGWGRESRGWMPLLGT